MNLQTFTAPTMNECLTKVKQTMGHNVVILHTRSYSRRAWLGLMKRNFVEITAGTGIGVPERRRPAPAPATAPGPATGPVNPMTNLAPITSPDAGHQARAAAMVAKFRKAAQSASVGSQVKSYIESPVARSLQTVGAGAGSADLVEFSSSHTTKRPGEDLLGTPAAQNIVGVQVARDVEELKKLVAGLVDSYQKERAPHVPEELFDFYMKLLQNQVADGLASQIVQTLKKQVRPEYLNNESFVREKLAEQIEKLIPTTGPIVRTKLDGPHVVALIGPTGVGKTTTIAKLAAKLQLIEKKRVGLITIDTYRIAAIDQLKRYADILGSPLKVTNSADDLREAVRSMSDCEYILIDTAGRSPRDAMKLNELRNFLQAASPDEVHLVLCSTASQDCVELAVEKFAAVHFDKVIFTKLDEAAHVGVVLNAIHKLNKKLSYVTNGQNVPDDIETGDGRRLAKMILG